MEIVGALLGLVGVCVALGLGFGLAVRIFKWVAGE
jgi:hypothetical protein